MLQDKFKLLPILYNHRYTRRENECYFMRNNAFNFVIRYLHLAWMSNNSIRLKRKLIVFHVQLA